MLPATFCQDDPGLKNMSIFTVKMKKTQLNFILFTVLAFCSLLLPALFTRGLFMDGLIYGSIARNLAEGHGTFWSPQFSETLLNHFNEHPPLAFGLQSLLFQLDPDSLYIERIYGLLVSTAASIFIALIYRSLSPQPQHWWMPVLLWICTERVFWSAGNNMLENTMSLFSLASSYTLIIACRQTFPRQLICIFLSALLLVCAFLSKGLPSLFPLVLPLTFINSTGMRDALKNTLLYLLAFAALIATGIAIFPEGGDAIQDYLSSQVSNSVGGRDRVGERWPFISGFFQQIIHMFILLLLIWILARPKMIRITFPRAATSMFLVGLCAFLPLLISPKLSFYYLVPAIPYFAIGFSLLAVPALEECLQKFSFHKNLIWSLRILLTGGIILVSGISISQIGKASRDEATIACVDRVAEITGKKTIIGLSPELQQDWTLIASLQRYAHISVSMDQTNSFYLQRPAEEIPAGFGDTHSGMSDFRLLKRP